MLVINNINCEERTRVIIALPIDPIYIDAQEIRKAIQVIYKQATALFEEYIVTEYYSKKELRINGHTVSNQDAYTGNWIDSNEYKTSMNEKIILYIIDFSLSLNSMTNILNDIRHKAIDIYNYLEYPQIDIWITAFTILRQKKSSNPLDAKTEEEISKLQTKKINSLKKQIRTKYT